MDIGESLDWAGHAIADAEMRLIGGMGQVPSMNIPFRLFTSANAAEAGVPCEVLQGLWRLQGPVLQALGTDQVIIGLKATES